MERAISVAQSAPAGPVYLSLPREPLAEAVPESARPPLGGAAVPAAPAPDPQAIATLATWLCEAEAPVILCQRGDVAGRLGPLLSRLAAAHGIGVAEPFSVRNVIASDDASLLGYDAGRAIQGADLVVVLDSAIPWIEALHAPGPEVRVAHVAPDPLFRRMPVRGYRADLAIAANPVSAIEALAAALPPPSERDRKRAERIAAKIGPRPTAGSPPDGPITVDLLSRCVSDVMDETAIAVTELGVVPGAMRLQGQNRLFSNPHSGGLGWALPAALGVQLADPNRLVIAAVGDGSYIFANPVACPQIAEAIGLPILTVIRNNGMWNAVRRWSSAPIPTAPRQPRIRCR